MLYFVLPCSADLRLLHSFPTRRSSDLTSRKPWPKDEEKRKQTPCARLGLRRKPTFSRAITRSRRCPAQNCVQGTSSRSEEHTSELQSRLHLVCRLLLEKKKKKK